MKHSKLPWKVRTHSFLPCFIEGLMSDDMPYSLEIMGDDYNGFGDEEQRLADAEFIVRACNAHEGLVKALESAIAELNIYSLEDTGEAFNSPAYNEALAAAKGQ